MNTNKTEWDSMTPAQRTKQIKKDRSMRDPMWAGLVRTLAGSNYEQLTPLHQDAVNALLRL